MKKIILALALVIPLSGCAGFTELALNLPSGILTTSVQNPVRNNELAAIEDSVIIARILARDYINLGVCKKGQSPTVQQPCALRSVVLKIQSVDRKISLVLPSLRSFVKNNDQINAKSAIVAIKNAVTEIHALLNKQGITK